MILADTERNSWARCGTYPGQDKSPKPARSAHSRNPKAGVKLKPYEQSRLCSPSKSLAAFQLTLKQVFETQSFFIWWNVEKQPPQLVKWRGTKQCSCAPASPSPFGACKGLHWTPSPLNPCNFLSNFSVSCNFTFYVIHDFERLLILAAPCKSNGNGMIKRLWTGCQRSSSSCEQQRWHQKWVHLMKSCRHTAHTLYTWGHTHTYTHVS